ncbi:H339R-like protein [Pacmanvirus S19]|nr:H339R-like protein [Pacmanvirus S19]
MSRVKVKKIKVPVGMKDEGLAEMFNQMLGAGSVNMTIAYPRYIRMKGLCEQLVKLFEMLSNSPFMRAYSEFGPQKAEIDTFCQQSREQIAELFTIDFSEYEWNLTLVEDELKKAFTEAYEKMKKSNFINVLIQISNNLIMYKKNFTDLTKLNHKFITTMPGTEWAPFPFTHLNVKYIFSLIGIGENTIRFFMTVLNKAFELSYKLYEEISSPDIDVDQFVKVIMTNIGEIQKRPELSRCRKAFQKIKESVELLKGRFNNYYRDFIATKDSTIMMQHFIIDVSKSTEADPQVTVEFRRIIAYYRKIAQEQITNPKIKMLFEKVNDSFKELERGAENLVNIREETVQEEPEDSDEITITPVAKTLDDISQ